MWCVRRCVSSRITASTWSWRWICQRNHIKVLCSRSGMHTSYIFLVHFPKSNYLWTFHELDRPGFDKNDSQKNQLLMKYSITFAFSFRQSISKLNWRPIIKVILKFQCVRTIIRWLWPLRNVSINIRWKSKVPKTINSLYPTRPANVAHSSTELSCRHMLHAHNVYCNGRITRAICGAHAKMALNHLPAENQVNF